MRDLDYQLAPAEPLAPGRGIRVAFWLSIFFAGELLTWIIFYNSSPYFVLLVPFFPSGLGGALFLALSPLGFSQIGGISFGPYSLNAIISYGFYFGHLHFTWTARSRKKFLVLMAILVVAVCINALGLHLMIHN